MFRAALILIVSLLLLSIFLPEAKAVAPQTCDDVIHVYGHVYVTDPSRTIEEVMVNAEREARVLLAQACESFGGVFTSEHARSWIDARPLSRVVSQASGWCSVTNDDQSCESNSVDWGDLKKVTSPSKL